GLRRPGQHEAAPVLLQPGPGPIVEEQMPGVPGATSPAVLQAADDHQLPALPVPARLQLQGAVVVEQLRHAPEPGEAGAVAHQGAATETADGGGGLRTLEGDRRPAAGAGRAME